MTGRTNKYGLSRHIPADVKLAVRRACGFGCVICGRAIVQYEHFDPPFEEAREHRAEGIALLCGACHDKKTRGLFSANTVAEARTHPKTFKNGGVASDVFDLRPPFVLQIGTSSFENVSTIVRTYEGERWLVIEEPEAEDAPVRLTAIFHDKEGHRSLELSKNEWICFSDQWDTYVKSCTIVVKRGPGDVALELVAKPPHIIQLSRLVMRKGDLGISVDRAGRITLEKDGGVTEFESNKVSNADSVFLI